MDDRVSRRRVLGSCAGALAAGMAGCNVPSMDDSASDPPAGGVDGSDASAERYERLRADSGDTYADAYQATIGSVVQVRVYGDGTETGTGTGFLYEDGHVITNQHVVGDETDVYVRFPDGGWRDVTVAGTDVYSDLAVLSVSETPDGARPLSLWDADPPIGTEVVAIGNPFGLSGSVSAGIVSGVDRTLPARNDFSIPDAIQTDAPVNPGNSGGPLVSLDGRVVGVINSGSGDSIGFAISGPLTRRVGPALIETGGFEHAYMGVRIRNVGPLLAEANDLGTASGVYVDATVPGGPAEGRLDGSSGDRAVDGRIVEVGGDVIVALDGADIRTRQELASHLALETDPGDAMDVSILRDGIEQTVELTLGSRSN